MSIFERQSNWWKPPPIPKGVPDRTAMAPNAIYELKEDGTAEYNRKNRIGDIKYSTVETGDHDGWILLDGRLLMDIPEAEANEGNKAVLYELMGGNGSLPQHTGRTMMGTVLGGNNIERTIQPIMIKTEQIEKEGGITVGVFMATNDELQEPVLSLTPGQLVPRAEATETGTYAEMEPADPGNPSQGMWFPTVERLRVNLQLNKTGTQEAINVFPPTVNLNAFVYVGKTTTLEQEGVLTNARTGDVMLTGWGIQDAVQWTDVTDDWNMHVPGVLEKTETLLLGEKYSGAKIQESNLPTEDIPSGAIPNTTADRYDAYETGFIFVQSAKNADYSGVNNVCLKTTESMGISTANRPRTNPEPMTDTTSSAYMEGVMNPYGEQADLGLPEHVTVLAYVATT